jgi:hypothetical protein
VLVVEDTTELLRAQRQLAWKEVAQRVAHEIKNPLTPDRAVRGADSASIWMARHGRFAQRDSQVQRGDSGLRGHAARRWWISLPRWRSFPPRSPGPAI